MESATLETLETALAFSVSIIGTSENPRNVTFSTTMLVTPPDSPFRAAHFQPWRRMLRTTLHSQAPAQVYVRQRRFACGKIQP